MQASMPVVRQDFQSGDHRLARLLGSPIYESWLRCLDQNIPMDGPVNYDFLSTDGLKDALYEWKPLIESSGRHLDALHHSISGSGWSVLFTDRHCQAIRVYQSKNISEPRIMQAFRQGAKLSELQIGTSAMSCAISTQQFVRVTGEEHYRSVHRNFNCAAVPVFDHLGQVCGTVDITNESPISDINAYLQLETCARRIQTDLIRSIPDAIVLELEAENQPVGFENLVLALSYDQRVVGANQIANRFLRLDLKAGHYHFDELFDDDFSVLFDKGMLKGHQFALRLIGGINLQARVLDIPGLSDSSPMKQVPSSQSVSADPAQRFYGDQRIQTSVTRSLKMIERLPVLLSGESGVGKEVVAREIHERSNATGGPFISLNCASIPETLIESELFGYERGAFTGANREGRTGKIQQANGGTLFLDEIGDMPVALQTRLLRVLETREVEKLGSTESQQVSFQLICATHKDLPKAIDAGEFRQDLFYRINGFELRIPALRDRTDIAGLANYILQEISNGQRAFTPEAMEVINAYRWPGNVRELRSAIVYADTMAEQGLPVCVDDLPESIAVTANTERPAIGHSGSLNRVYDQAISQALELCDGNMTRAAKHLGISRATLYRKLSKS